MKQRYSAFISFFRQYPLYRMYLLLLLLALGKQIILPSELVDSGEYKAATTNLLAGNGWSACLMANDCEQLSLPETRRTPGYPILIAIFGSGYVLWVFQFVLAAWVPLILKQILINVGKEQAFKPAMALLLLYPLQYYYTVMVMPDILCQVLVLAFILAYIQKNWFHTALTITALLLLKPVFMPWAWFALIGIFWAKGQQRLWLVLPVFAVMVISWINHLQTGIFHFTSISVTNAFEYNIKSLTKGGFSNSEMYYRLAASKMDSMDFAGKYQFMQKETQKAIRLSLKKYAYLHAMGSAKALLDPGRYDFVAFFQLPQGKGFMDADGKDLWNSQPPLFWVYIIFFALLALIKGVLSVFALLKPLPHKGILLFVVLYMLLIVGPVGSARYLLPVMPIIIVLSATGWSLFMNTKNNESSASE